MERHRRTRGGVPGDVHVRDAAGGGNLYEVAAYRPIRDHVEKHKKSNPLGSFLSMVCQDVEILLVTAAYTFLREQGVTVRVNMYDGLMIDRENCGLGPDDKFLQACGDAAFRATGYRVQFVEKPIVDYTGDLAQGTLFRVHHHDVPPPTTNVVLFSLEGTLVH
jgi:hypothetical protein